MTRPYFYEGAYHERPPYWDLETPAPQTAKEPSKEELGKAALMGARIEQNLVKGKIR